jgi:hypothetical protein
MPLVNLEGIAVTAFMWDNSDFVNVKSTTTDASGNYTIPGLRAEKGFKLKFTDPLGNYLTVYSSKAAQYYYLDGGENEFFLAGTNDIENWDGIMPSGISISGQLQGES